MSESQLTPRTIQFLHEDERIKPGKRIFSNPIAAENGPKYITQEAAKFFGLSSQYLRKLERDGVFTLNRERGERREFNLFDIENISYALADDKKIDYERHMNILNVVYFLARVWGIA